ncbi:adenylate/guanylate cyclase domain-containing protein [Rhodococcus sp. NPDC058505]|uniref:adenylate/guanylate cyclase domain-containing protein n=1 Tax=unclassified Rhodococcus (in: high G+C Gram-positive bacteria) TaxID=192944 RepID=UPI0036692A7C
MTEEPAAGQSGDGARRVASALAWLRAVDSAPAVVDTVRRVRRALPGDASFGDPLSTAGPGGVRAVARVADRLRGERPGAAREAGFGALQLWQAVLERTGHGRGTREMTLVFTDLVGYSDFALAAGDEATIDLLREVARAIEPPVVERGGLVVKRMGDGMMAVFARPDRAIEAVFAARSALGGVECHGHRPRMRVGVHTGIPRQVGADWLGVDVNIAARVMQAGADGHVMASAATVDALGSERLAELGLLARPFRRGLFSSAPRGVPADLRMYTVQRD